MRPSEEFVYRLSEGARGHQGRMPSISRFAPRRILKKENILLKKCALSKLREREREAFNKTTPGYGLAARTEAIAYPNQVFWMISWYCVTADWSP